MKKLVFVILILVGLESFAQKHPPVFPYNESGYTLTQFKDSLLARRAYNMNVYQCFVDNLNEALRLSRRSLTLKEFPLVVGRHDDWIFQHIFIKDGVIFKDGFTNSYKNGNVISPFWDKKEFRGSCFAFRYDGLEVISAKTICMNLIKSKFDFVPIVETTQAKPEPEPVFTPQRVIKPAPDVYRPANVYIPPVEKTPKKQIKIWRIVIPVAALIGIAAYLLRPKGGPAPAPGYPADTGGPAGAPGYPANTGTTTGGPTGAPGYGG